MRCKECWRKRPWHTLKCSPEIFLHVLKRITRNVRETSLAPCSILQPTQKKTYTYTLEVTIARNASHNSVYIFQVLCLLYLPSGLILKTAFGSQWHVSRHKQRLYPQITLIGSFFNEDALCFLWLRNWIFKHYLNEFQVCEVYYSITWEEYSEGPTWQ
jgi:hypothetical protein